MKIAILTHPLRFNYGGIIQNYALQTVLKRMGHDVMTIDVHPDKSLGYIILSYLKRNVMHFVLRKNVPTHLFLNLTRKQFLSISANLQKFIKKNISTTEYIRSYSLLSKLNESDFEVFIVGSDQVWQKQFLPATLLNFLQKDNVLRIAYAASFGQSQWQLNESFTIKCKQLLARFKAVSVREISAVGLCKSYLERDVKLVLDPTLLLTANDYNALLPASSVKREKNIMCYILDPNQNKERIKKDAADYFRASCVEVKPKVVDLKCGTNINDMIVPPIEEWLQEIRDAEFVVTDSFHGMAFSIIFNKQFIAIGNYKRGIDRFQTLLSKLNLLERLVDDDVNLGQYLLLHKQIDYSIVNKILEVERKDSMLFLAKALK